MNRSELLATGRHPLTYCTNVHPASDLASAEAVYREHAAPTLRRALGDGPLCLGAWWPADVASALASDETLLARHGDLCRELGLVPLSLNVFPMGRFHGAGVKEAVYAPDWSSPARLQYTLSAGQACAALLRGCGRERGVLSTLPLGFRGKARDQRPSEAHARNVFRLAVAFEALQKETGVHLVLALEPEPWCLLETIDEAVTWIGDEAMALAARWGNEAAVRRHVGVCIDLCHAAVVGESATLGCELCAKSGVRIGKVQLSSALVARGPRGLAKLLAHDEPVYLHQTWRRGGEPYLDLADERLRQCSPAADDVLVSHFHVPLHWEGDAELGSTKSEVTAFLDFVRQDRLPAGTPLEVETYTNPKIAEEVVFATDCLLGRSTGREGRRGPPAT